MPSLTSLEIQTCREIFDRFDVDGKTLQNAIFHEKKCLGNGTIDVAEMKVAMEATGQPITNEELFFHLSEVETTSYVIENCQRWMWIAVA